MKFELYLFGPPRLRTSTGQLISIATRKAEALLYYLAAHPGDMIPRPALCRLLWPRSEEAQARASLRQELAVLRRAFRDLGVEPVNSEGASVTLAPGFFETDLSRFKSALGGSSVKEWRAGLDLYTGPFLADVQVRSDAFDDWIRHEASSCENMALNTALQCLERTKAEDPNAAELERDARKVLEIAPAEDRAHLSLMQFYEAAGQKGRALEQYRQYEAAIDRLVDLTPSEEAEALMGRILRSEGVLPDASDAADNTVTSSELRRLYVLSLGLAPALNPDLGPEPYLDALIALRRAAVTFLKDLGGHVQASADELVVACFGYPTPCEHEMDRLLASTHSLRQTVIEAGFRGDCMNIALVRGTVLVEDGLPDGPSIKGPPVAASVRLSQAAPDGSLVVDDALIKSIGREFGAAGAMAGFNATILAPRSQISTSPTHWLAVGRATGFVGRRAERVILRHAWARVQAGQGHMILIEGEPGVGKSRLVSDFLEDPACADARHCLFEGARHRQDLTLWPLVEHLRHAFAIGGERNIEDHLSDWVQTLGPGFEETIPYLSAVMEIVHKGHVPQQSVTDDMKRLLKVVVDVFRRIAGAGTMGQVPILVFEDVQWFDPTSLAALERLVTQLRQKAFVIMTSRAGECPREIADKVAERLSLPALPEHDARALVEAIGTVAEGWREAHTKEILTRAEGNPLIAEELALAYVNALEAPGAAAPRGQVAMPANLEDTIVARHLRFPEMRELSQMAAVLGRRFWKSEISAALNLEAAEADRQIAPLVEGGVLSAASTSNDVELSFKHALLHEYTYNTIAESERRALHLNAARTLASLANDGKAIAGELARHYQAAGAYLQAAEQFEIAGKRAAILSANAEAVNYFDNALHALEMGSDGAIPAKQELDLILQKLAQVMALHGVVKSSMRNQIGRASELAEQVGRYDELIVSLMVIWSDELNNARLNSCELIAHQVTSLAEKSVDVDNEITARFCLGSVEFYRGQFDRAIPRLEAAVPLYSPGTVERHKMRFGNNMALLSSAYLGWCYAVHGDKDKARDAARRALQIAQDVDDDTAFACATTFAATQELFIDDIDAAERLAHQALRFCEGSNLTQWHAQTRLCLARVADKRGAPGALGDLQTALADYLKSGMVLARAYGQVWIAEAMHARNRGRDALLELDDLAEFTERTGECYFEARANELRAQITRSANARAQK